MEPRSRRVPVQEGLALHLLEWSQEGVPLLLVHGFSNEAHVWDDFAPRIAAYYRTLAVDLRGHGDSDRHPEQHYDYEHHLGDLETLCAHLDIERLVVVGHSLGGRIATFLAARHPERMAGLVLVDSGPELDPRGVSRIRTDVERKGGASFASPLEYERALARAYPAATPAALARLARHGLRAREDGRFEPKTDPAFHRARAKMDARQAEEREQRVARELWEALAKIPCPTLVVRGAASDVLPAECADRMAEEVLPRGQLAVVAQAGHSVMTDNPEGFAEAVLAFAVGEA